MKAEHTRAKPGEHITIHGAREHNLKNLSLELPRNQFVVVTGVSGSGKSTLAFDLLFAEGQRRFLDSMNLYARQFVEQLSRPDVDLITGIPPTVSIEQRTSRGGGKSTVATVTEVYHFVRLLFARLGTQYCPDCQAPVEAQTRDALARRLEAELARRGELRLLAPVVMNRKGFHTDVAEWASNHGYAELRADGKFYSTHQRLRLDRFREHDVEIVAGTLASRRKAISGRVPNRAVPSQKQSPERSGPTAGQRIGKRVPREKIVRMHEKLGITPGQLIDEALTLGNGMLFALDAEGTVSVHSTERSCPRCGRSFEPIDPKLFSYNSPQGWCPRCRGFGELFYLPEVDRGARADAIEESWYGWQEGSREPCPECGGARLNRIARAVRLHVGGVPAEGRRLAALTIEGVSQMSVEAGRDFFERLRFKDRAAIIARDILPEIRERLRFLCEVGLGYLQLGRGVPTLSGGEGQRIRLAAQLGSNLSGVLYILDEPTIGLHARDNEQLLAALDKLRGRGNSVLVVEHDEETMRRADYILDLGPGAGVHGGEVVAAGTLRELLRHRESITGQCLRSPRKYPSRGSRRAVGRPPTSRGSAGADPGWLCLQHANKHNLKDLTLRVPLGRLVLITGVSGSGKSTLIRECLLPAVTQALDSAKGRHNRPATDDRLFVRAAESREQSPVHNTLQAVYEVDQSPIGRTPRSIPATYVGFFDEIRRLFAQTPEARLRGYLPGRFSFNSAQGRCPECEGAGALKLEMSFLPPAFVPCESCHGTRFNRDTLDITYRGKTVAEVLELSVEEAIEFFAAAPRIKRALQALNDTGLGYLKLGQTSPTLSGGEAQRVKLVTHLLTGLKQPDAPPGRALRRNLFILEEPTIGLHIADVRRLVDVLQRLVDAGHSVIVIEHNLDLIAEADWVIDLGPEGGDAGGRIVAEGTPEEIGANANSHTGRFLRKTLKSGRQFKLG